MRRINKQKILAVLLASALAATSSIVAFAEQADTPPSLGSSSSVSLGASAEQAISTPEELKTLADAVNSGADFSRTEIRLENDINLSSLENWVPIGTESHPFTGIFNGNDHIISGVGEAPFTSLFGHISGGTVKNLSLISSRSVNDANPYSGLFVLAENATIINCRVMPSPMSFLRSIMPFSSINPTWFADQGSTGAASYTIANLGDLLAFVGVVNEGQQNSNVPFDFNGKTITITGPITLSDSWTGIGTKSKPFQGTITGNTISNLVIHGDSEGTGFFSYTENATLSGFTLKNVSVSGSDSVGALVGYGTNTAISGSSVTGSVSGSNNVGGLAGTLYSTASSANAPKISNSYSTATVSGSYAVGGLLGAIRTDNTGALNADYTGIEYCFTTGPVTGNISVGGIAGFIGQDTVSQKAAFISESASISTIHATGQSGGLLGEGERFFNGSTGQAQVVDSYFAGKLQGFDDLGGLVGAGAGAKDSYVSGIIIAPGGNINPGVGLSSASASSSNVLTHPGVLNGPLPSESGVSTPISAPSGAFSGGVDYPAITNLASLGAAFAEFSTFSTTAAIISFPSELYRINTGVDAGKATVASGSLTPLALTTAGGVQWFVDYRYEDDGTLAGGSSNPITISGGAIAIDQQLNREVEATVRVHFSSDIDFYYPVIFKDEAVRPILDSIPAGLEQHDSLAAAQASTPSAYIAKENYLFSLKFSEPLNLTGTLSLPITKYSDGNYGGATTTPGNVSVSLVNSTTLKIQWDPADLDYGASYSFALPTVAPFVTDDASPVRNTYAPVFYFRTVLNHGPTLSFESAYPLATENPNSSTSTAPGSPFPNDVQVIYMQENAAGYGGFYDGIVCKNPESYIDIAALPATMKTIGFTSVKSMAGQVGYPATATQANFQGIPGEYVFTYQVKDPEDNSLTSNTIQRTYRINSAVHITQGGAPLNLLIAKFDADEMVAVYSKMQHNNWSVAQAMEDAIIQKYVNRPGSEQLNAFWYDHTATPTPLAFHFDTSVVTDSVFQDGYEQPLHFTVGSETYLFVLSVEGVVPDYEIIVDEATYIVENEYAKGDAKAYFNPRIIRKSDGVDITSSMGIRYDFSKVLPYRYDVPQEVTITATDPSVPVSDIAGVDMQITAKVNIMIRKTNKFVHPEDKEDTASIFWDTTMDWVKKAEAGRTFNIDLSYASARRTPADFFRIVENQEDVTVNFTLPSGIKMIYRSDDMRKSLIPVDRVFYSTALEPAYDINVIRDAGSSPVQQFFAPESYEIPGTLEVIIPLTDSLLNEESLVLYRIDETDNQYVLVKKLSSELSDDFLVLDMTELEGRYVVTSADLAGSSVSVTK